MNSDLLNIKSKHIELRPATREDVPLIFELRRSERGSWLNSTSDDISLQYEYFERYLDRFLEGSEIYYVIIDRELGGEVGIFRLTRIDEEHGFGWEGLVMKPNTSPNAPIDICATVYELGFMKLNRQICGPWTIKHGNRPMLTIHKYMNTAFEVDSDSEVLFYAVAREDYLRRRDWLQRRSYGVIEHE